MIAQPMVKSPPLFATADELATLRLLLCSALNAMGEANQKLFFPGQMQGKPIPRLPNQPTLFEDCRAADIALTRVLSMVMLAERDLRMRQELTPKAGQNEA